MTDFDPPLKSRTNNELIKIAHSEYNDWQEEAIQQAKEELNYRAISTEQQKAKMLLFREQERFEEQKIMESRKLEDYSFFTKIAMVLFWFKYLFSDWFLKKQGYVLMRKRRLQLLSLGLLITILSIAWVRSRFDEDEKKRLQEIDNINVSDWEQNRIKK